MVHKIIKLFLAAAIIFTAGCKAHSVDAARAVAIDFMTALYTQGDAQKAMTFCNSDYKKNKKPDELKAAAEKTARLMGKIEGFSPVEYMTDYRDDYVVIRYAGVGESKIMYFEATLAGTSKKGYKVAAFMESETPFKPFRTGKKITD